MVILLDILWMVILSSHFMSISHVGKLYNFAVVVDFVATLKYKKCFSLFLSDGHPYLQKASKRLILESLSPQAFFDNIATYMAYLMYVQKLTS